MSQFVDDDLATPTEADLDSCYGSKYLGAADLGDRKIRTRIAKIRKEMMPSRDGKPARARFVVSFTTLDKSMVLNATNKNSLVDALGGKPADWINAEIGLYTEATQFGGKSMRGLRLKVLSAAKARPTTEGAPFSDGLDDLLGPDTAAEGPPWSDDDEAAA
jgi:hypothetical protein